MGAVTGPVCSPRACGGAFLTAHAGAKAPQWVMIPFPCTNPQRAVKSRGCGCAVGVSLGPLWGLESFNLCPSPAPRLLTARPSMSSLGTSSWPPRMDCLTTCLTTWSCRSWKSWRWVCLFSSPHVFCAGWIFAVASFTSESFVFYIKTPPEVLYPQKAF